MIGKLSSCSTRSITLFLPLFLSLSLSLSLTDYRIFLFLMFLSVRTYSLVRLLSILKFLSVSFRFLQKMQNFFWVFFLSLFSISMAHLVTKITQDQLNKNNFIHTVICVFVIHFFILPYSLHFDQHAQQRHFIFIFCSNTKRFSTSRNNNNNNNNTRWYMPTPESVLENETHKVLWDFEIQTHHLVIVHKKEEKKRIYRIVDFAVPADHR